MKPSACVPQFPEVTYTHLKAALGREADRTTYLQITASDEALNWSELKKKNFPLILCAEVHGEKKSVEEPKF